MEIKIDKTFVVVLIASLLFGNLLYMWGRHIGKNEVGTIMILQGKDYNKQIEAMETQIGRGKLLCKIYNEYIGKLDTQIEVIRVQLSQLKP